MGIPMLRESLCGCNLKTGTKIIGWYGAIVSFIAFAFGVVGLVALEAMDENKTPKTDNQEEVITVLKVLLVIVIIDGLLLTFLSVLLLVGAYKDKPSYLFPWLVVRALSVIGFLIAAVFSIFNHGVNASDVGRIIGEIIGIYCMLVVYSHYRVLRGEAPSYA